MVGGVYAQAVRLPASFILQRSTQYGSCHSGIVADWLHPWPGDGCSFTGQLAE